MQQPQKKYITDRYQPSNILAYMRLAVAIVEQACKDANGYYSSSGDHVNRYLMEARRDYQMKEVKNFFYDDNSIFGLCMPHTDGPTFYKQIMSNYKNYGYYMPPQFKEKGGDLYL